MADLRDVNLNRLAIFVAVMLNPAYTSAIVTIGVVFVAALVLFAVWGRKRLVLSPEEEYALTGGLAGDPATTPAGEATLTDAPGDDDLVRS